MKKLMLVLGLVVALGQSGCAFLGGAALGALGTGHPGMVTYSAETRVMYLGRVYPVSQLRIGDIVAMQMGQDSRGNPHTHMISLQKSSGDWAQRN
jgi:hypothetical protein